MRVREKERERQFIINVLITLLIAAFLFFCGFELVQARLDV